MIKAVFFDLDGTLLPMDQDEFVKYYFGMLAKKVIGAKGYDKEQFINSIWQGVANMVKNDGTMTNEERWWQAYTRIFGPQARADEPLFREFYANEFNIAKNACGCREEADKVIKLVKTKGMKAILATNPIFPRIATENRMKWAGLDRADFELFTTYEDYRYSKPNLDYYREILAKTGLDPQECAMVGNDVGEDMIAAQLGMKVFLLTDCIINKNGVDISQIPHGGFEELIEFIEKL
ncbi:MAG: HAD family hydrolase [Oscillospiraceae bacterium]|nr:HAD family hydrolase [Oscillospiraceae bacterium]